MSYDLTETLKKVGNDLNCECLPNKSNWFLHRKQYTITIEDGKLVLTIRCRKCRKILYKEELQCL